MGWAHPSECLGAFGPDWASQRRKLMPTSFYSDALINVTIILLLHRRVPPATNALHFMIMEGDRLATCSRLMACEGHFLFCTFFLFQFKCFLMHSPARRNEPSSEANIRGRRVPARYQLTAHLTQPASKPSLCRFHIPVPYYSPLFFNLLK